MNTVHGMIAFLRAEADLAEARAKQLRLTAALIQSNQEAERPSTAEQPARKKRKTAGAVGRSEDAAGTTAASASPEGATTDAPSRQHPYGMGYALFLHSHVRELNKQRHRPPAPAARHDEGTTFSRRGRGGGAAAAVAAAEGNAPEGDVLAALEHKWNGSNDREKRAWQARAEQMHQAAAIARATNTTATDQEGGDASPVSTAAAVAAAAAATGNSLDYEEGEDDGDEEEADNDDDEDEDDDNLEPLDAAEGDDDWADRKRPATKNPSVPV